MDKELESRFQDIWIELANWDKDDVHINRIRVKLKKIQVMVYNGMV